jgi:hypothetical protein
VWFWTGFTAPRIESGRDFVNRVIDLRVPQKVENYMNI